MNDLDIVFQAKVRLFIKALEEAGIKVIVSATKRNEKRAYLFHWCWKLAQGKVAATGVPAKIGVDIEWNHGTEAASRLGAAEMVSGFGLALPPNSTNPPALASAHIAGKAIDMTLTWMGTKWVKKKDGSLVDIPFNPNVNSNVALHAVGQSYGVYKLKTDKPHWSHDGR